MTEAQPAKLATTSERVRQVGPRITIETVTLAPRNRKTS